MSSPFEAANRAAGAVLREVEGGEYPIRFAHPFEEHRAVRRAAGLIDLSFLGKLEIAGPDAREFLHRIASADLSGLKPGQGAASYVLSAQGKIQHSFEALATPDGFLVIAEGSAVPALIQDLETFRFGEKVGYRDFTNDLGALLLCGPNAEAILRAAAEGEPPPASAERSHTFLKIEGSSVLTVCDWRTGSQGYLLLVIRPAAEAVLAKLDEAGGVRGLRRVGLSAYDSLRLEAGRPRFGLDFGSDLFPQEVGIASAFSLTKGCYPGQETVARIDTYGRVHRRLCGLVLDSPREDLPERGDKLLLGNEEVGEVKSWAISPSLERPIAFAVVKTAKAPAGTTLAIHGEGRELTAKVVELPIVADAKS